MKLAFATLATVTIVLTVVAQDSIGDRTIDGSNNNLDSPLMGAAHTPFSRFAPHDYQDDISAPGGAFRPNVRHISNMVFAQMMSVLSKTELSDMVWQWGQVRAETMTMMMVMVMRITALCMFISRCLALAFRSSWTTTSPSPLPTMTTPAPSSRSTFPLVTQSSTLWALAT